MGKITPMSLTFLLAALAFGEVAGKDNAITAVVAKLNEMLTSSKDQGENERLLFAKFKCYCDTTDEENTASIKTLGEEIEAGEAKVNALQADNKRLGGDISGIKKKMKEN